MSNNTKFKLGYLFAVPFIETQKEDPEKLNAELTSLFLEKETHGDLYRDPKRRDTQQGGIFESRFDLFKWQEAPAKELTTFCHTSVARVVHQLSDYSEKEFSALRFDYHAWFHITRAGGYQGLHMHPNASWSGIYCVDPGDDVPDRPDSGVVRFHDPRNFSNYYSDAGNERLKHPAYHGSYQFKHVPGKLLIFPSYLQHEIFPYFGNRPRIIVAFNCWIINESAILQSLKR